MRVEKCPKCGKEKMYSELGICLSCGYRNNMNADDKRFNYGNNQYYNNDESLCTDYEGKCGNCHKNLGNDEYCRYCGTKRGEGTFEPYQNVSYCIYGPAPRVRVHTCPSCNYEWRTHSMIANEKHCPKCGNLCKIAEQPENLSLSFESSTRGVSDTEIPNWIKNKKE